MPFYISILATSLSLDAFGVGIVYGMRRIKIPFISKLAICFFSVVYAASALAVGKSLYNVLSPEVSKIIGVAILVIMGFWIIIQSLLKKDNDNSNNKIKSNDGKETNTIFELAIKSLGITVQIIKNPSKGDIDRSGVIDMGESLLLGLALSIDAIGVGIGSALAGFHSVFLPFMVGLFQLFFLYLGTYLGEKFILVGKGKQKVLSLAPGFLLIFIAILRLC